MPDGHHVDKDYIGHGNDDDDDDNVVFQNNDNHQRASRFSSAPRRGTGRRSRGAESLFFSQNFFASVEQGRSSQHHLLAWSYIRHPQSMMLTLYLVPPPRVSRRRRGWGCD